MPHLPARRAVNTYDLTKMKFVEREAYDWAGRQCRKDASLDFDCEYAARLQTNIDKAAYYNGRRKKTPAKTKRTQYHGPVDTIAGPGFGRGFEGHFAYEGH